LTCDFRLHRELCVSKWLRMSLRSTPTPPQPGAPRSPLVSSSRNESSGEDEKCDECVEDEKMREPGQRIHTKKEEALDALDKEISKKSTIQQNQPPDDISTMDENTNDEESVEDTVPIPRDDKRGFKIGTTSRSQKGSQKAQEKKNDKELYTMSLQFTEEELGKAISTTPLWKKLNEELRTKSNEIHRLKKVVTSQRQMIGNLRTRLSSYKPKNSTKRQEASSNDVRDPMLIKVGRNSSATTRLRSPQSKSPTTNRITGRNPTISILKRGRRTPRSKIRLTSISKRPKTSRKPKKRPSNSPRTRAQSVRASRRKSHDIPGRTEKTPVKSRTGRKKMEQAAAAAKTGLADQEKAEDILPKRIMDDDCYQSSSPDYKASREHNRRSKSAPKKRHHGHRSKTARSKISHPRKNSRSKNVHLNSSYTIKKNKASSKTRSSSKYTSHSIPIRIDERKLPVSGEPVIVRIDLMRGHDSEE